MYAIANIVYGFPVSNATLFSKLRKADKATVPQQFVNDFLDGAEKFSMKDVIEALQESDFFFEHAYSGSADEVPTWFGTVLGRFEECKNTRASALQMTPNETQKTEVHTRYAELPAFIRNAIPETEIDVYIIWSTS